MERIILSRELSFRWRQTNELKQNYFNFLKDKFGRLLYTSPVTNDDNIVFSDDLLILEPSSLYRGRKREYVSVVPRKKSLKYIILKSKYYNMFEKVLEIYSKETNQNIRFKIVRNDRLFKNSIFLIRLSSCTLKKFPVTLNLELEEIIKSFKKGKQKVETPTTYLVRGKRVTENDIFN